MSAYTAVTPEEALEWLRHQAIVMFGAAPVPEVDAGLRRVAEAMAALSAMLPDEMEPAIS